MLKQFSIILSIYFLGELFQKALELPVPGNILGMLILFFGLLTGVIKLEMIDRISDFLLDNLAFFFLPAGVSLITCFALLEGKWTAILGVSIISTVIILGVTGLTVEFVKKILQRKLIDTAFLGKETGKGEINKKEIQVHERIQTHERAQAHERVQVRERNTKKVS
ncbi:CidA/LrgA family protein [Methanosarcina sp.]|uniref:CidA/LrgA family protein n=1 Tax=Methanosarcina sp. TaxID=2213 RepID=UPI002AB80723|nr:CidA/LrgA family protein [Methanosarcina sp.]MDY9924734.1 CidA/LrgA family protein [Methanosarcina sp.]